MKFGSITTGIISDGLIFNMDPANRASYPKTGTTATDTISDITGSLTNDVFFSKNNDGVFNFDGTDDIVNLGNVSELNFNHNDTFTLSVWVKRDSAGSAEIIRKMEESGNYTGYQLAFASDQIRIYHRRQNQTTNRIYRTTDDTFTSTTEWYHIVSTYDASRANTGLKIYVNGSEPASTGYNSMNAGSWTNNADFKIGRTTNGEIACIQIYNRVLSANEVLHNYNALKGRFE